MQHFWCMMSHPVDKSLLLLFSIGFEEALLTIPHRIQYLHLRASLLIFLSQNVQYRCFHLCTSSAAAIYLPASF